MTPEERAKQLIERNTTLFPAAEKKFQLEIENSIQAAILEEREACAKIAEEYNKIAKGAGALIADTIRARGEK